MASGQITIESWDIEIKRLIGLQQIIWQSKIGQMQNQTNQNHPYSFIVVPTTMQYFTLVPLTPSTPDFIPPSIQNTFNSAYFSSGYLNQLYYNHEQSSNHPISTTSLAEQRQIQNLPSNIDNTQRTFSQHFITGNMTSRTILHNHQQNPVLQRSNESNIDILPSSKKLKNKQTGSKFKLTVGQDREYVPKKDRKKKEIAKYHQNEDRNIIPNEINQIFSFIQKFNKSGYILEKLFNRFSHPQSFTIKRFYLYQSLLKNKLGHYTNQKSLKLVTELYQSKCEIWPEQEQRYYNKLCRILIRHFLYEDSIFMILTSKRMKSGKKSDHLRARRIVTQKALKVIQGY